MTSKWLRKGKSRPCAWWFRVSLAHDSRQPRAATIDGRVSYRAAGRLTVADVPPVRAAMLSAPNLLRGVNRLMARRAVLISFASGC